MLRRIVPLVLALPALVATSAPADATAADTAAAMTCQGQDVTLTGTPGDYLEGTPGPDVIETNGAVEVRALGGDDLICVDGLTGSDSIPYPVVYAGEGDDGVVVTQTRAYAQLYVLLGLGKDSFVGGAGPDEVTTKHFGSDEPTDGFDTIDTGAGPDAVSLHRSTPAPGADSVDLGPGADTVALTGTAVPGDELHGGIGQDVAFVVGCTRAEIDAAARTAACDSSPGWTVDTDIESYAASAVRVSFTGTPGPDRLDVSGRHLDLTFGTGDDRVRLIDADPKLNGTIEAGRGRDVLVASSRTGGTSRIDLAAGFYAPSEQTEGALLRGVEDVTADQLAPEIVGDAHDNRFLVRCATAPVRGGAGNDLIRATGGCGQTFVGGAGNDVLVGNSGDDTLLGGPGRDRAVGNAGRDECSTEIRSGCES